MSYIFLVYSSNFGSQHTQAFVDVLVTTVNLFDVVNATLSIGGKSGDEQRHTGTDVG